MSERIDTKAALEDSADLIEAMEKYPDETLCIAEEGFRLLILKQRALAQEIADREALEHDAAPFAAQIAQRKTYAVTEDNTPAAKPPTPKPPAPNPQILTTSWPADKEPADG